MLRVPPATWSMTTAPTVTGVPSDLAVPSLTAFPTAVSTAQSLAALSVPAALGAAAAAAAAVGPSGLSEQGAAGLAAMNHVEAIHMPVWFPLEDPPLAVPTADPAYTLEDQVSAQIPPRTPLLTLGPVPLVTTAPAVQENSLPEEDAPY